MAGKTVEAWAVMPKEPWPETVPEIYTDEQTAQASCPSACDVIRLVPSDEKKEAVYRAAMTLFREGCGDRTWAKFYRAVEKATKR